MAQETRTQLKTYFETGDRPTEAQFINLIDSQINITDDVVSQAEAEAGTGTDVKAWTPERVKQAIDALGTGGIRYIQVLITDDFDANMATGDGAYYMEIPAGYNGMDLVEVRGLVITAGTTGSATVMVHNVTDTVDMLSAPLSFASAATTATGGTINTATDDVITGDVIRIDVDTIHTTPAKGCIITLGFNLP